MRSTGFSAMAVYPLSPLRELLSRRPEWWAIALSLSGWMLMVIQSAAFSTQVATFHSHHDAATATYAPGGFGAWIGVAADWMVMVIAMMLPLVLGSIRTTASKSLWA